jgi:hypothetical protein
MGRRGKPTDPAVAAARAAMRRAERAADEARAARNPDNWGVDPVLLTLQSANDVDIVRGACGRIVRARRQSDAFDMLYQAGGLTVGQHQASERYYKDWLGSAGIQTRDTLNLDRVDAGRHDGISQGAIDAGRRLAEVHGRVGPAIARLLSGLVEPWVMRGEIRVWRVVVAQLTGETERHSQAGQVRLACENLRLAYEEIDEAWARRERVKRPVLVSVDGESAA